MVPKDEFIISRASGPESLAVALSVLETSKDLQWLTVEGPWARQVTGVKKEEKTGQLEPVF